MRRKAMIYHCNACRFTFQRFSPTRCCPDCGKENIRYATKEERDEFRRYQEEFDREERMMRRPMQAAI